MLALRGGLVDRGDGRFERADVAVDGGRVAQVGAVFPGGGAAEFDARACAVLPGMVNAHTHSNENWFRGRFDNLPLEVWLLFAYPLMYAPRQDEREIYVRTALGAMEMLRGGTTSVVDFLYELPELTEDSLAAVAAAYRDVGMRVLICLAVADRSFYEGAAVDAGLIPPDVRAELDRRQPPPIGEWLAACRRLVDRFHRPDEGIGIGLAPAGPHRCSDELLLGCLELAEERELQIHTHTLETRVQVEDARAHHGRSVIEHLADIGFLAPRVHLCHGVWLTERDAELVAEAGASLVHNPLSNLKLGSGIAPLPMLRDHHVHVALGTDGMCSADGQDMLQAVKLAAVLHKVSGRDYEEWISAAGAWAMATRAGARPVGDPDVGRLEAGARADVVLMDLEHPAFTPLGDPQLHVALQVPTGAVRHVLAGGRWAMVDGRLTGVDEPALLAEARELAPRLNARSERAFAFGEALVPSVAAGWRRSLGLVPA